MLGTRDCAERASQPPCGSALRPGLPRWHDRFAMSRGFQPLRAGLLEGEGEGEGEGQGELSAAKLLCRLPAVAREPKRLWRRRCLSAHRRRGRKKEGAQRQAHPHNWKTCKGIALRRENYRGLSRLWKIIFEGATRPAGAADPNRLDRDGPDRSRNRCSVIVRCSAASLSRCHITARVVCELLTKKSPRQLR